MVNYMDHGFEQYTVAIRWSWGTDGLLHITAQRLIIAPYRILEGSGFIIIAPYQILEDMRFIIIAPYRRLEGCGFMDRTIARHDYCAGIDYCTLPDIGG